MIYICIPAYNEAATVGVLLWKIRQVLGAFPRDYHVLVLDDGSTDDTRDVLAPYAQVLPLTILRNKQTKGYAAAQELLIREVVKKSTHPKRDVLVLLQADFTEAPEDIPSLVKRIEGGADIVSAEVVLDQQATPWALRWSRKGLAWLLRSAPLPETIRDPFSGFRAYRVAVLKRTLVERNGSPLLTQEGWAANAELLLTVLPHARRTEGLEVTMRYDRRQRETRFRPWSTVVEAWNLARRSRHAPRPLAEADAAD